MLVKGSNAPTLCQQRAAVVAKAMATAAEPSDERRGRRGCCSTNDPTVVEMAAARSKQWSLSSLDVEAARSRNRQVGGLRKPVEGEKKYLRTIPLMERVRWWSLIERRSPTAIKRRKRRSPRFVRPRGRRSSRPNNPSPNVCWPRRQRCPLVRGRESYCNATHTSMVPGKTGSKTARKGGETIGELSGERKYQHSGECNEVQLTGEEATSKEARCAIFDRVEATAANQRETRRDG